MPGRAEPREAASPRDGTQNEVTSIGLTGGLAAGKSTALSFFRDLGAITVSADDLVARLYAEPQTAAELRRRFGPGILDSQGVVDRARLGEVVKREAGALKDLEAIVHPRVAEKLRGFLRGQPPGSIVVSEIPLLFESGLEHEFDLVVTIEAGLEVRRSRWEGRPGAQVLEHLDSLQLTPGERLARSDLGFVNEGDLDELRAFVAASFERACSLAKPGGQAGQAKARREGR